MRHATWMLAIALIALLTQATALSAKEWHVDPNAGPDGEGSAAKPWTLAKAFSHPEAVKGGDTIWLHGGKYVGGFTSDLKGEPNNPIVVRQATGERATIDGNFSRRQKDAQGRQNQGSVLFINGAHAWYRGFEVMSSYPTREYQGGYGDVDLPWGIDIGNSVDTPGIKLINLAIHDTSQGPGIWMKATDAELYGCIIYNNGYDAQDRGHGHATYQQNKETERLIVDNIMFNGYSHGIHVYGSESPSFNNFRIRGNILFNNGAASSASGYARGILIGGGRVAENPVVEDNFSYYTPPPAGRTGGAACLLRYGKGSKDAVVRRNVLIAPAGVALGLPAQGAKAEKNVLLGRLEGFTQTDHPDNTYLEALKGMHVMVRPNKYEPGRAHIAVFNGDGKDKVEVDVSKVLQPGQTYEVLDAQNPFGKPVLTGTYDGKPIALPTVLTEVAQPNGQTGVRKLEHTTKEFNAYVLRRQDQMPATAPAGQATTMPADHAGHEHH